MSVYVLGFACVVRVVGSVIQNEACFLFYVRKSSVDVGPFEFERVASLSWTCLVVAVCVECCLVLSRMSTLTLIKTVGEDRVYRP